MYTKARTLTLNPSGRMITGLRGLAFPLLAAAALKAALLTAGAVPFNSDEAVVGLMARHILQGARPVFFYGQAYMGSLDAFLVALAFRLLGEGVLAIRVVQSGLYLLYLLTLWLLARRFFTNPRVADIAAWLAAVPTVLVSTYTTASLGGYGETLVFGNLILLLGYEVVFGRWQNRAPAWLALGLAAGLAFWTLGMAGVYLLPVAVLGLLRFRPNLLGCCALAGLGFLAGSFPWWQYNLNHQWAALSVLAAAPPASTSLVDHLVGFLLLGLPAVAGWRAPWSPEFLPWPQLLPGLLVCLSAIVYALQRWRRPRRQEPGLAPGAGLLLGLLTLGFAVVFLLSRYGIDATGRYLLPLTLPLTLLLAAFTAGIWRQKAAAGLLLLLLILGLNSLQTVQAAVSPAGLTTQFGPITRFDNRHDQELVDFLRARGETRGYANYWVSFRLAFLSQEDLIFAARLPYKANLDYAATDDRCPAYSQAADAGRRTAYITSLHPGLDEALRRGFSQAGVTFAEAQIGPYHVFYELSAAVRPEEMGFGIEHP